VGRDGLHKDGSCRAVRTPVIVLNSGIHEANSDSQFMDAYDAAEELSDWLVNTLIATTFRTSARHYVV
jgi:hypothetical protein